MAQDIISRMARRAAMARAGDAPQNWARIYIPRKEYDAFKRALHPEMLFRLEPRKPDAKPSDPVEVTPVDWICYGGVYFIPMEDDE